MAEKCKCPPPGLPAWMGTFADLMSLLMCFFVLLLSFSEMDVNRQKDFVILKYVYYLGHDLSCMIYGIKLHLYIIRSEK